MQPPSKIDTTVNSKLVTDNVTDVVVGLLKTVVSTDSKTDVTVS